MQLRETVLGCFLLRLHSYSLVLWNWFSDVTGCTWITCIQWGQRTDFTAPGCTLSLWFSHLHFGVLALGTLWCFNWRCWNKEPHSPRILLYQFVGNGNLFLAFFTFFVSRCSRELSPVSSLTVFYMLFATVSQPCDVNDRGSCYSVDEVSATCENRTGAFLCYCPSGYRGDGKLSCGKTLP